MVKRKMFRNVALASVIALLAPAAPAWAGHLEPITQTNANVQLPAPTTTTRGGAMDGAATAAQVQTGMVAGVPQFGATALQLPQFSGPCGTATAGTATFNCNGLLAGTQSVSGAWTFGNISTGPGVAVGFLGGGFGYYVYRDTTANTLHFYSTSKGGDAATILDTITPATNTVQLDTTANSQNRVSRATNMAAVAGWGNTAFPVEVDSTSTPNDGGRRKMIFDSANLCGAGGHPAADGYVCVNSTVVTTGSWNIDASQTLNESIFGADCTNTTDSTVAVQAMFNAAVALKRPIRPSRANCILKLTSTITVAGWVDMEGTGAQLTKDGNTLAVDPQSVGAGSWFHLAHTGVGFRFTPVGGTSAPNFTNDIVWHGFGTYRDQPAPTSTTLTGTLTSGSATITGLSVTAGVNRGDPISGSGIPANAYVTSVNTSAASLTFAVANSLAQGATSSGTGVSITTSDFIPCACDYDIEVDAGALDYDGVIFNSTNGIHTKLGDRLHIRSLKGQPLGTGLWIEYAYDTPVLDYVHFWPYYSSNQAIQSYMAQYSTALKTGRADSLHAVEFFAYGYGTCIDVGQYAGSPPGPLYGARFDNAYCDFVSNSLFIESNTTSPTISFGKFATGGNSLNYPSSALPSVNNEIEMDGTSAFVHIDDWSSSFPGGSMSASPGGYNTLQVGSVRVQSWNLATTTANPLNYPAFSANGTGSVMTADHYAFDSNFTSAIAGLTIFGANTALDIPATGYIDSAFPVNAAGFYRQVASGGTLTLPSGRGEIYLNSVNDNTACKFFFANSAVTLEAGSTNCAAAPAPGKLSLSFSSSSNAYVITNNLAVGATQITGYSTKASIFN